VLEGILNNCFAVLDQGIYYIGQPSDEAQLQYFDFSNRRSVTVARNLGNANQAGGFTVAHDGRTILYARLDSAVDDLMLVDDFQ
jgi:hypothetical protein